MENRWLPPQREKKETGFVAHHYLDTQIGAVRFPTGLKLMALVKTEKNSQLREYMST
jgi:hypothetical protein